MADYEVFGFDNGIRCVYKRVRSGVVHCGLTINAGTRDELEKEHGTAHLIEHMLFKGTERRRAYHINSLLENGGGELNAFTSKEETVVHATTLKSDFPKAADLICDVTFRSVFPAAEIDKEKAVILDEINSYKDSPSELIYDDFEDRVFSGSSLGRNILGTRRQLGRITRDDLVAFAGRCYNTDQMVFSVVGDLAPARVREICRRTFGSVPARPRAFVRERVVSGYEPFCRSVHKGTYQAHCLVGNRAYPHDHPQRVALALLVNILGGPGSNSRLNLSLREKNGLSYNVEAGYSSYGDTGLVSVYFGTDRDKVDRCFELLYRDLDRLRTERLSALQLSRARKQLIGQLAVSSESNESDMLGAGKSYLVYGRIDSMERIAERLRAVTPADLLEVANDVFAPEKLSTLIYQ